jgi:hypothetical protein
MGSMDAARAAGFLILGLSLAAAGFLGAPLHLLLLIGAVPVATLFLPGGVGAAAAANLAQKLYDREAWEADWDKRYLPQGQGDRRTPARSGRREDGDVEPDLFPDDLRETKAWLRTLATIRHLPEGPRGGLPSKGDRGRSRPPKG